MYLRFKCIFISLVLFMASFLNTEVGLAANSLDPYEQQKNAKIDELYSACIQQKKKDKLCDSVITAKQIGNDSVEYIKEYMELTPTMYALLTLANFASTGRIRIKTKSFLFKKAQHVYDYQRDDNKITFIFEKSF